jgi:tetratricopeptide (TPR) repeat protein
MAIQQAIGEQSFAAYTYLNLGYVLLESGDESAAELCYEQAVRLALESGYRDAEAYALSYRGTLRERRGRWADAAADYEAALALRGDNRAAAIEDTAGLARVALGLGDLPLALQRTQTCLAYIEANGVEGIEFPLTVYLTCYDILRVAAQPQAHAVLTQAHGLLRRRAEAVSDTAARQRMLSQVAAYRRVQEAWEAGDDGR